MKKLIAIILGIGALIAIGLGVALSLKSKEIKAHLEQTLNESFEKIVTNDNLLKSWEPFVCEGLITVSCYSKKIILGEEEIFTLYNAGFDIHSIDNNSLQASFKIKDIKWNPIETTKEAELELVNLISSSIPQKLECDVALKRNDDKLSENIQCNMKASNASYELNSKETYQHSTFNTQNMAKILENFYLKAILATDNDADDTYNDVKYAFDTFMLKAQNKGEFSKDMYKLYEVQSKIQEMPYGQEGFAQYAKNINTLALITASFVLGDVYHDEMITFGNALESYLTGQTHELGIHLSHQENKELKFKTLEDFAQSSNFSHFSDDYTLTILSK
ncbi:hypothetical protein [Helicobacter hepaticus]|jgi:hypothetical protein|uniref:hypothetical protein n=1 Tax=Helicobacter hepaticus TaxID=32025 RepID=UPI0002D7598C|nr:hypothetical protein [Helicobacter hepaticus]